MWDWIVGGGVIVFIVFLIIRELMHKDDDGEDRGSFMKKLKTFKDLCCGGSRD